MSKYQKQVGDIVELTDSGIKAIESYKNNYTDETRPISSK